MKNRLTKITFRKKIIITVVGLASIPVILFGLNALRLAGRFQAAAEQTKNRLLFSLSTQAEDYFTRINESLAFIQSIERKQTDASQVGKILFNALNTNREMISIGHIRDNNMEMFFGDESRDYLFKQRVSALLKKYEKKKSLHISEAFTINGSRCFDLLYPLGDSSNEALFMTFTLREIEDKLNANKIDKTGQFSLISGQGNLFAGSENLSRRLDFIKIGKAINNAEAGVLIDEIKGYQIKGKKLDLAWPLWMVFTQQKSEANALSSNLRTGMILFLVVILFTSVGLSFALASEFSIPISNLLEAVKKNYSGELEVKAHLRKKDKGELALLIKGFNKMIDGLREAREKLIEKEKMAAVGEMANVIGHDIRNPLSAIKNGTYFLKYSLKSANEKATKTMNIIEREIENITEIIENLLGYSRQKPPTLNLVDVNSLIDEAVSIIDIPENVEIVKEYSEKMPKYNLDKNEIKQVLVNIINNAVQACDKEKGTVKIITSKEHKGNLNIRVIDNGMGISKDKMENIFKAFYSTKGGGTGLGMSSAKNIVERHEGSINIKSEVGKGTEMIISIPPLKIESETAKR